MTSVPKLLSIASSALGPEPLLERMPDDLRRLGPALVDQLVDFLKMRNGFYALESALHVFPLGARDGETDIKQWNDPVLWRAEYGDLAEGCLFFAEDVFGGQFCIKDKHIYAFDTETGSIERLASSFEEWIAAIVGDYESLIGYPLAHEWQMRNGAIPAGKRLLPKIPFVAGGEFEASNLYLANSIEGMLFRASLARQIKDLPDGAQIKFEIHP